MTKSYPKDIKEVCREYRPDGPTPCLWPGCDCDGLPAGDVEAYLNKPARKHALGSDSFDVLGIRLRHCGTALTSMPDGSMARMVFFSLFRSGSAART